MNEPAVISKKILIIEDEAAIAKALEFKLKKLGYTTDVAMDGSIGLGKLREQAYNLVLLDLMMPNTDGWTVMETMQKEGIQSKVIVTSNLSQEEDVLRAKKMGACEYLVKSNASLSEIVAEIERQLL